jgi:lysozyme
MVLIKSFEGFRPRAVQEEDGRWIIGYGHTASAREGLTVAEADAELLLQYDLMPVVKAVNEQVRGPLNQHQFDALASFAVSVGVDRFLASDVLQRLNEGHAGQAADALIGWPEDASADARLRRRAAERALFVADPASAVTLAELLAAPLPPPPVAAPAPPEPPAPEAPVPEAPATDARTAALATLLGEAPAAPEATAEAAPEPAAPAETPAYEAPAFQPADAVTRVNLDRYSPYAAAIVGPLPGFAPAQPAEAPVVQPVFTFAPQPAPAAPVPASAPEPEPEPEPAPQPEPEPAAEPVPAVEPEPVPAPAADPAPVTPMVSAAPIASPFPAMDPELVLTPATEADFVEVERPVWPSDQRAPVPAEEETVLFEDEPTLSVLRHEVEPAGPRRFDWSETGAFLIMGGVGLAACGASAAAFRLAVEQPSPMGETTVIAWALALIGIICVGVSSWNLYVRWGKPD